MSNIFTTPFGSMNGREARLFHIGNEHITACVTDFGAALARLYARTGEGIWRGIAQGYENASGYLRGSSSVGATVGRYAGRIGGAAFTLGGRSYELERNDGNNHLHGGFGKRFWDSEILESGVKFSLLSPDGDEGFPGELKVSVTYETEGSSLRIIYKAETDRDTVVNLTNHSYFNLAGSGDIAEHRLRLAPDTFAELDGANIPTGRLLSVKGTKFDFTSERELADTAVDHSFILNNGGRLTEAARLSCPGSGLALVCRTDQPTIHVYTADYLQFDTGAEFPARGGVCLETQHLPDSPNKPGFPTTVLRPGEIFESVTEFEIVKI